MTRQEAIVVLRSKVRDYLSFLGIDPSKNFRCLNPEHNDTNPSMSLNPKGEQCHCFSCGVNYDIFDLIRINENVDFNEALKIAASRYGIQLENDVSYQKENRVKNQNTFSSNGSKKNVESNKSVSEIVDYKNYFEECAKRFDNNRICVDYLLNRGITVGTAKRFNIGFDPEWRSPAAVRKGKNVPPTQRLIIPTSDNSYLARAINPNVDSKFAKMKEGSSSFFNIEALNQNEPVFVVEGEIDAMSICQTGANAIGLGSLSNVDSFLKVLEKKNFTSTVAFYLDNDERGNAKLQELKKKYEEDSNLKYLCLWIPDSSMVQAFFNDKKDANEALVSNPTYFQEAVSSVYSQLLHFENIHKEKIRKSLESESAMTVSQILKNNYKKVGRKFFSTGFENLDEVLGGGFSVGLYTVGAISSLGKTTLCIQMADYQASQGNDVLIFSLEMSASELVAKSASRLSVSVSEKLGCQRTYAKSANDFLILSNQKNFNERDDQVIFESLNEYDKYSNKIHIYEGETKDLSFKDVESKIRNYVKSGLHPIVVIDYLQLLALSGDDEFMRLSDKQKIDKIVMDLKKLSRELELTIIAISSFNRESYTTPVAMSAFKESGNIEYTSSVVIALQYFGMDFMTDLDGKSETADSRKVRVQKILDYVNEMGRKCEPFKVEAKVLKNRFGTKGSAVLDFIPKFNIFSVPKDFKPKQQGVVPKEMQNQFQNSPNVTNWEDMP